MTTLHCTVPVIPLENVLIDNGVLPPCQKGVSLHSLALSAMIGQGQTVLGHTPNW